MGGGKKSKAPAAPDYAAAARAQGEADKNTAMYTTAMDRPNQYSPYGSSTWEMRKPGEGEKVLTSAESARASYLQTELQRLGNVTGKYAGEAKRKIAKLQPELQALTGGGKFFDPNNPKPGDWIQRTQLTPEEQRIFDAEQGNRLSMEGLAGTAIGRAKNTISSDFNPNLRGYYNAQGLQRGQIGLPELLRDRVGLASNTLSGLKDVNEDPRMFAAQGDQVRDALYKQLTRFSGERFGEEERSERSRLAQMGLQEGTQAYQNALQEFRRAKDESYAGSQLQAVLAGGQEQSRMIADLLASRQSNIGLRQGQFGQNMARDQQDMAERMNMFNTGAQRYQLDQGERQAMATSELNMANLAAAQRQQQFNEQAYQRSLPINEISALLNGGGVNMPTFSGFAPSAKFNAPDLLGATQAQYNANMGQYNAQQQQKGSLLGAGAGFLGGIMGK